MEKQGVEKSRIRLSGALLHFVCVISAFCVTGVPQNAEIARKPPSTKSVMADLLPVR